MQCELLSLFPPPQKLSFETSAEAADNDSGSDSDEESIEMNLCAALKCYYHTEKGQIKPENQDSMEFNFCISRLVDGEN